VTGVQTCALPICMVDAHPSKLPPNRSRCMSPNLSNGARMRAADGNNYNGGTVGVVGWIFCVPFMGGGIHWCNRGGGWSCRWTATSSPQWTNGSKSAVGRKFADTIGGAVEFFGNMRHLYPVNLFAIVVNFHEIFSGIQNVSESWSVFILDAGPK